MVRKIHICVAVTAIMLGLQIPVATGQRLTFTPGICVPAGASLSTAGHLTYYFSDDVNSVYDIRTNDLLKTRSLFFPEVNIRYLFNDNFFVNWQAGYLSFLKELEINYNSRFQTDTRYYTQFDYSFFTNSLSAGYRFFRGKEVRLIVSAGIDYHQLVRFKEVSRKDEKYFLINQYPYGHIIHQNFSEIVNGFLNYQVRAGIEYYLFTFQAGMTGSITDINASAESSFYKGYTCYFVSAGINLIQWLPRSGKNIKHQIIE
jgi:hypothetical protein